MIHSVRNSIIILLFSLVAFSAYGAAPDAKYTDKPHVALETNLGQWLNFGTVNASFSFAPARHLVLHLDGGYNPWVFNSGSSQMMQKQISAAFGARWYFWYNYSGLWAGMKAQYEKFQRGGLFDKTHIAQGDAFGLGLGIGYSLMLYKNLNIDLGAYAIGGPANVTRFEMANPGKVSDSGSRWWILPDTVRIALVYVF